MRIVIALLLAALMVVPAAAALKAPNVDNARSFMSASDTQTMGGLMGFVVYLSHMFTGRAADISITLLDNGVHRTVHRDVQQSDASYRVFAPYDYQDPVCDLMRVRVKSHGRTKTRHFPVCF